MTKSKLIRLLEGLDPTTVLYRLYDIEKLRYKQYESIVNKANERHFIEEVICGEITLQMVLDQLKHEDVKVNDYIRYENTNNRFATFREIYEDFKHIANKKEPIAIKIQESLDKKNAFYEEHKNEIDKYYEDMRKMWGMMANTYNQKLFY